MASGIARSRGLHSPLGLCLFPCFSTAVLCIDPFLGSFSPLEGPKSSRLSPKAVEPSQLEEAFSVPVVAAEVLRLMLIGSNLSHVFTPEATTGLRGMCPDLGVLPPGNRGQAMDRKWGGMIPPKGKLSHWYQKRRGRGRAGETTEGLSLTPRLCWQNVESPGNSGISLQLLFFSQKEV